MELHKKVVIKKNGKTKVIEIYKETPVPQSKSILSALFSSFDIKYPRIGEK